MAFTRKFLKALGLEDEKIDTIIEEHTNVTTALTAERDRYKAESEKAAGLQRQLDEAGKAGKNAEGKAYKDLYDELIKKTTADQARAGKTAGYKASLKAAGVPEKFWPLILAAKTADIDKLEMEGEKVKGADDLLKSLKTEFAAYIPTQQQQGAGFHQHLDNDGGGQDDDLGSLSMEDYIAKRNKK